MYPTGDDEDDEMADNPHGLGSSVPEAIRKVLPSESAIEALGAMIWYVFNRDYHAETKRRSFVPVGISIHSTSIRISSA